MVLEPDLFDRIMALPGLRVLEPFYRKHKEALLYLFFGGLTFLVSMAAFALFYQVLGLNELAANALSWVFAVLFAFFTNRTWVFHAPTQSTGEFLQQMSSFFGGRVATLLAEEVILLIFVTLLRLPALPVKTAAQVVVIVLNYFVSKRFVFQEKPEK